MIKIRYFLFPAILSAIFFVANARDDSQSELRQNPEIETSESRNSQADTTIEYPSYINLAANKIQMNGADWSRLAEKLTQTESMRVDIVHIGDSHLQADMGTSVTRHKLSEFYGSAGRSLIVPFKLAGTNEPVDYSISVDVPVAGSRLLKTPWPTDMGFTGIGVRPEETTFNMSISASEPFDSIAVFYSGDSLRLVSELPYRTESEGVMAIALPDTTSSTKLMFSATRPVTVHGLNLVNGNSGMAYHVIGNNGATFSTYNAVPDFVNDVARFNPALIIISLGTNEAFGTVSNEEMRTQMRMLLSDIRKHCPDAAVLLTTPSECQRKISKHRKKRRKSVAYTVNANVKRLRDVILGFAENEGIPVYDFYDVAGGTGSSFQWLKDHTLNKDRIHLTRAGYTLQGDLFAEALQEAFQNSIHSLQK